MNTLQISPLGGVVATPTLTGSPANERIGASANTQSPTNAPTPPTTQQQVAAVRAQHEANDHAAPVAPPAPSPQNTLQVGLVNGTFDVFVDVVDSVDHRTLARIFGPPASSQPDPGMPAKSAATASDAYAKSGSSGGTSSTNTEA